MNRAKQYLTPLRYDSAWREKRIALGGLPPRYQQPWAGRFDELLSNAVREGVTVLDVGSGRQPLLRKEARPSGMTYVGLDESARELRLAPAEAYDRIEVADITTREASLERSFDLIVSWQVLEHVAPLEAAIANVRAYLKPGGWFIALFSGRYSPMALLSRAVPFPIARLANGVLVQRDPESMFQTRYDHCYASAIRGMMSDWSELSLEPRWEAAMYFDFFRPVFRTYLAVENFLAKGAWEDSASHYFLAARL